MVKHVFTLVYSHSTASHPLTFVDPVTATIDGIYILRMENMPINAATNIQHVYLYWNCCKTKLKRMKGCDEH